jgi:hypothetical protein
MQGHHTSNFLQPGPRNLILRGIAWAGQRPIDSLMTVLPVATPFPGLKRD